MAVQEELKALAVANGLGVVPISYSMPDLPDEATAIRDYGGGPPEYVLGAPTPNWERPRVQIVCRGKSEATVRARAQALWNLFAAVRNTTISGTPYQFIRPLQSPFVIQRDENRRVEIGFNLDIRKGVSP